MKKLLYFATISILSLTACKQDEMQEPTCEETATCMTMPPPPPPPLPPPPPKPHLIFTRKDLGTIIQKPTTLLVQDFNKDQLDDIVLLFTDQNIVRIWLRSKDGSTFEAATDIVVGNRPVALLSEDLDKDQNMDLAILNQSDQTVSLLFGKGDGTFETKTDLSLPRSMIPTDMKVMRFTEKDEANLMITSLTENQIHLFIKESIGHGYKTMSKIYNTGKHPNLMAVADFDNDGITDVVVTNGTSDHQISILMNDKIGKLELTKTINVSGLPSKVIIVDWNQDQNLDIALLHTNEHTLEVLLGDGTGSFDDKTTSLKIDTGGKPTDLDIILSADTQQPHFLITNESENSIMEVSMDMNGMLKIVHGFDIGKNPTQIALGQFNKDDNIDMIAIHQSSYLLSTAIGNASGFSQAKPQALMNTNLAFFDVKERRLSFDDSYFWVVDNQSNQLRRFQADGSNSITLDLEGPTASLQIAEVEETSGGWLDVATLDAKNNKIRFFLAQDAGGNWKKSVINRSDGENSQTIRMSDIDGDGHLDLWLSNAGPTNQGIINNWGNGDGTFRSGSYFSNGIQNYKEFLLADLNHDGTGDFIVFDQQMGNTNIFFAKKVGMNLSWSTESQIINWSTPRVKSQISSPSLIDINGDKILDIVMVFPEKDELSYFIGKADGLFEQTSHTLQTGKYPVSFAAKDIDLDGNTDLVVVNQKDHSISVFLQKTEGSFTLELTQSVGQKPIAVFIKHIDFTTVYPSIIVANQGDGTVTILKNTKSEKTN